jgi:hypothetical protein
MKLVPRELLKKTTQTETTNKLLITGGLGI